jgi:CBS domain containing-hemolysin-like protein
LGLTASVVLIAANGVFVAAEFSLVAADRVRFIREADAGDRVARRALRLFGELSYHLSGAQLGITVTSLMLGYVAEATASSALVPVVGGLPRWGSAVVALAVAASAQMVLGELVPKSVAISRADRTARVLAGPVTVYGIVAGPVIGAFERASNRVVRALGVEPRGELAATRSREELEVLIRSSGEVGALRPEDVRLLTRSMRFGEKAVDEVLVPRVEVVPIGRDATVAELVALAIDTGYSRFPVIGDDLDDVVGVVHVKSIYGLPFDERDATLVTAIMSEVLAVPEARDLAGLFADFRATRSYLAVVVDEHGGTAGIVTLEDVLEELVGEIADEYDELEEAPSTLTKVDQPGTCTVSGALHRDELREACGFALPEGDYETLAGFVLDRLDRIPEPGARFDHDGWTIEVVAMDRLRVARLRLVAPQDAGDGP